MGSTSGPAPKAPVAPFNVVVETVFAPTLGVPEMLFTTLSVETVPTRILSENTSRTGSSRAEPPPEAMDKGQGSGFGQGGVVLLAVHSAGVPLNTPVNLCRFPALSPT